MPRRNRREDRERLPQTKRRPNRAISPDSTENSGLLCRDCIVEHYCPVHDGVREYDE